MADSKVGGRKIQVLSAPLRRARQAVLAVGVASFSVNMLMLVPSIYMLEVYDRVLPSRSAETLLFLTIIMIVLYLVMATVESLRAMILSRIGLMIDRDLRPRALRAIQRRSIEVPGHIKLSPLQDLETVRGFVGGHSLSLIFDLPWTPVFLFAMALMDPLILYIGLGAMALLLMIALTTELITRRSLEAGYKLASTATASMDGALRNTHTIEAMGMFPALQERWLRHQSTAMAYQTQASDRIAMLSSASRFVRIAVQSLVLGAGAYLALQQLVSPGMMIAGSILLGRALAPIEHLTGTWRSMVNARVAYRRIGELLAHEPPPRPDVVTLPSPEGDLVLDKVVILAPDRSRQIVKGISLHLQPGRTLAIIGNSGSGKSTLAKAICGAWPVAGGTIRLDGVNMPDWPREQIGPHIGYLPQEVDLFDGTVAENICRFGQTDSAAIITAAQTAGVHELVLKLPKGYETQLRDNAGTLSGGQRQRIALARALYRNPTLVILDEPNSNLDTDGDTALAQALLQMKTRGATVIIISHRPNILSVADTILLMRDGSAELYGPTASVLAKLRGNGNVTAFPAPSATTVGDTPEKAR